MKYAVWWIRRDIRLFDNIALSKSLEYANNVIPLFINDPNIITSKRNCNNREIFLYQCLRDLDIQLKKLGNKLIFRNGNPEMLIPHLYHELSRNGDCEFFAERDYTPYAKKRDQMVKSLVPLNIVGGAAYQQPEVITKQNGLPYTVFTPYAKAWKKNLLSEASDAIEVPTSIPCNIDIVSEYIPNLQLDIKEQLFPPNNNDAMQRLKIFSQGLNAPIYSYNEKRNILDMNGTSQLSPYLKFGILSINQVVKNSIHALENASSQETELSVNSWLNELIWRDFFIQILNNFPYVKKNNFRDKVIRWENDSDLFNAWCNGATGYPIIDAAMRQLLNTGWMHNRARMLVASFLTKNLLIDWRWGEEWFMQHLLDGDIAANNGGWQWAAGTGSDAVPYFRIFNPIIQSMKYDPQGSYIRKWIPELFNLPKDLIHSPGQLSNEQQKRYGCIIGKHYPTPIINYEFSRRRALEAFKSISKL